MKCINLIFILFISCFLLSGKVYSQNRVIEFPFLNIGDVSWSPDSRELVFSRWPDFGIIEDGARINYWGIYKINSDGTGLTTLYQKDGEGATYPDFSPDGTKIAFVIRKDYNNPHFGLAAADRGTIWIMDANGGNLKQITTEPRGIGSLSWSADGLYIIYLCAFGPPFQVSIFKVKADGSELPTQITLQDSLIGDVVQSRDGKYLAVHGTTPNFRDKVRLWIVSYPDGTILNRFYESDEPVYWSQDNNKIVCRNSVINVSDGSFVPLPVDGLLSPDGSKIFYTDNCSRAGCSLYVMFLDTPILLNQQK